MVEALITEHSYHPDIQLPLTPEKLPQADEALNIVTFVYSGFGVRQGLNGTILDEHGLLRNAKPRFPGHYLNKYLLPEVDSRGLVYDRRYTTETGWDDKTPEVLVRYAQLASYAGIDTLTFAIYGGIESEGTKVIMMEDALKNFPLIQSDFPNMHFAPMICAALPRLILPIDVPVQSAEDYRFTYINQESFEFMAKYLLAHYYARFPDSYFTIDGRPAIFLFDYIRIAIDQRHGINPDIINASLDNISNFAKKHLGVDPYYIAIINNPNQAIRANACNVDLLSNYIDLPYFDKALEWPIQQYTTLTDMRQADWDTIETSSTKPFTPALVSGFDATCRVTPRGKGKKIHPQKYPPGNWYPLIPVVPNETHRPIDFRSYARAGVDLTRERNLPFVNLGPLNELTEQCSLLPTYSKHPEEASAEIVEVVRDEVALAKTTMLIHS